MATTGLRNVTGGEVENYVVISSHDYHTGVEPILIGSLISFLLFGSSMIQFVICFEKVHPGSNRVAFWLLVLLCVVDIGDIIGKGFLITQYYSGLVLLGGVSLDSNHVPPADFSSIFLDGVTASVVHVIYLRRLVRISPVQTRNFWLWSFVGLSAALSVLQFVYATIAAKHALQFPEIILYSKVWLSAATAADVMIVGALLWRFLQFKPEFRSSKDLVKQSIIVTLETGVLPTLCQVMILVTFLAVPSNAAYFLFVLITPKVYINCVLFLLRSALHKENDSAVVTGTFPSGIITGAGTTLTVNSVNPGWNKTDGIGGAGGMFSGIKKDLNAERAVPGKEGIQLNSYGGKGNGRNGDNGDRQEIVVSTNVDLHDDQKSQMSHNWGGVTDEEKGIYPRPI